jgi:protein-tyrosine phosphatase
MIDLHTHILPGLDDGIETEEEAVEFARMAVADGVQIMVATPHCKDGHWVNDRETVLASVAKLKELLREEGVELAIEPGAEVHLCEDLIERIRDGRALTLADNGKTLLLELSLTQYPVELDNLIFKLKLAGVEPLFAHPERIRYFQDDIARYESAIRLGGWGQITTGSIMGLFGHEVQEFSEEILRKGLAHALASDGHSLRARNPVLSEALSAMIPIIGEQRALAMCNEGPRALLDGREPDLPAVDCSRSAHGSFLARWFRRR